MLRNNSHLVPKNKFYLFSLQGYPNQNGMMSRDTLHRYLSFLL